MTVLLGGVEREGRRMRLDKTRILCDEGEGGEEDKMRSCEYVVEKDVGGSRIRGE